MAVHLVAPGVHMVSHRGANMYLLDDDGRLVLVDTGFPGSEGVVLDAIAALGHASADLGDIILTHAHYDHVGSAAALVAATGARTWMHPVDAPLAESGRGSRPMKPAPGLLRHLMFRLFAKPGRTTAPVKIDELVEEGATIPLAGGLRVIHVPGHCAGQIALGQPATGILFAADTCMNILGLGDPIGFEDRAIGRASQRKLAALDFTIACFGHGQPLHDAAARFRARWGG
ncbi:MBL fold metallo-hydrolase [Sphingomonas sp.]|uniref:MBL fold metallo-hydrolase n=1 Tax=Sphingomonas sp. TaxID=28214 RepID=UPI003CC5C908